MEIPSTLLKLHPSLVVLLLFCVSIFSGALNAEHHLGKIQGSKLLAKRRFLFFFRYILDCFSPEKHWELLLYSLQFTRHILQASYLSVLLFFFIFPLYLGKAITLNGAFALLLVGMLLSLLLDLLANFLSALKPKAFFQVCALPLSLLLLVCFPLTYVFFKLFKLLLLVVQDKSLPFKMRDKILELFSEGDVSAYLDGDDQQLVLSFISFKERIAREVMVPRIQVYSLPAETTIRQASQSFLSEGYSRIPVYKDNVDNIIGVLLYKDLIPIYIQNPSLNTALDTSIENLVKPVLYTPETKKISHLLQEFRSKQLHLAIVVDEYGGTEGIVTIEDILEVLVGEIADEYDVDEEDLFSVLPSGGWIVDAKMSIIDIAQKLHVEIPFSPEYDTLGGYIFHRAGAIPSQGWRIHQDNFDLEVLSSNERAIEKIYIRPAPHKE